MTNDRVFADEIEPTAVILRQDNAFGADKIDIDMWLSTLFFPVVVLTAGQSIVLADRDDAIVELRKLEEVARIEGCAQLRTRVMSHLRPAPDLAILCSIRERLTADDEVLASTSVTWTLVRIGDGWLINQIIFDDYQFDRSIASKVPRNKT